MKFSHSILIILIACLLLIGWVGASLPENVSHGIYLTGNGSEASTDFPDSSNGRIATAFGNAKVSTTTKVWGSGSASFDGTNSYITTPITVDDSISSSYAWSLRGSYYFNDLAYTGDPRYMVYVGASPDRWQLILDNGGGFGTNNLMFLVASTPILQYDKNNLTIGEWYDIGITQDHGKWNMTVRNATNTVTIHASSASYVTPVGGDGFTIGRLGGSNLRYFKGYIDDFIETNGTLLAMSQPQTGEWLNMFDTFPVTSSFTLSNISVTTNTSGWYAGRVPFQMQFTDLSSGAPISWVWNARNQTGDNVQYIFNSTHQYPKHTFLTAGDYIISLNATNVLGTNTSTQITCVNVSPALALLASFNPPAGTVTGDSPVLQYFYDTSSWV